MGRFSWTNHNSLLRIVANEIASLSIQGRLRQMAFFVLAKVGKGVMLKDFETEKKAVSVVVCLVIIQNK